MVVTLIHRFSLLLSVCGGGFEQEGVSVGFLGVAWEMEGGGLWEALGWDLGMGGVGCLWGVRRDGQPPTQPAV